MAKKNNVVSFRKYNQLTPSHILTFIAILAVMIYIIVLAFSYSRKEHISIYEVGETKIADDATFRGIILREEKVYSLKQSGYVNYFIPEASKVSVGSVVYTVDNNGSISSTLENISSQKSPKQDEISAIREVIAGYQDNYDGARYSQVYEYQYDIKNVVSLQGQENLYSDLEQVLNNGSKQDYKAIRAKKSGVIAYTVDGFEDLKEKDINKDTFSEELSMNKQQLRSNNTISEGQPAYRLVTSNDWKLVIPLTEEYYQKLKDHNSIRVRVKKDGVSFNAGLSIVASEDIYLATLTTSRFMQKYVNERFLDVELGINSAEGLKIPNSSIIENEFYPVDSSCVNKLDDTGSSSITVTKMNNGVPEESVISLSDVYLIDGKYYIKKSLIDPGDTINNIVSGGSITVSNNSYKKLPGVYSVNEGYCQFVYIDKKYQNSEYTIVSSNTAGGLSQYDHIVVNPETLKENDFIQ